MKLLKYKNFTWPNNPSNFNIGLSKRVVSHEYPQINGAEHEELGSEARIFTGSGVFFGPNAYTNYRKLEKLYFDNSVGRLVHPKYGSYPCNFTKISSKEEPLPYYVEYEFEFVENRDINTIVKIIEKKPSSSSSSSSKKTNKSSKKYYTVKKGDTLWAISKKYYGKGTDWKKIADANKKIIKNPNLIYPGQKLLIP
jgi:nucleoid-associated protein YgaU